jgi:hypothetical protein
VGLVSEAMADRIVPSHFRGDGQPKRAYEREDVARMEAERLGMSYYRCDFCSKYHLAKTPDGGTARA